MDLLLLVANFLRGLFIAFQNLRPENSVICMCKNWRGSVLVGIPVVFPVLSSAIKNRVHPLMLGDLDPQVQEYIVKLREAGGLVNTAVVMAVMHGIVFSHDRTSLDENGGHLRINETIALSLLNHMNYVKRKGFTSVKVVPAEFEKFCD